jgi:hypothetical protein
MMKTGTPVPLRSVEHLADALALDASRGVAGLRTAP